MINFLHKVKEHISLLMSKNEPYMQLFAIKNCDGNIICEFNEKLLTNGKLIKVAIEDIFSNKNLQNCISPSTLLLIGSVYGIYKNIEKEYRITSINLVENSVTLENKNSKISLSAKELLDDENLIKQSNPLDLVKWVYPYAYRLGYDAGQRIDEKRQNPEDSIFSKKSNIIKFVNRH